MSADSPRRTGIHKAAQVVSAQPISDKSIIDSVAGIINDIVPQVRKRIRLSFVFPAFSRFLFPTNLSFLFALLQAYTSGTPNSENRESITWARFEFADINDPSFYPDYNEGSSIPPLLLVLGYNTGVQVEKAVAFYKRINVADWAISL